MTGTHASHACALNLQSGPSMDGLLHGISSYSIVLCPLLGLLPYSPPTFYDIKGAGMGITEPMMPYGDWFGLIWESLVVQSQIHLPKSRKLLTKVDV